jgi:hypothetical protein
MKELIMYLGDKEYLCGLEIVYIDYNLMLLTGKEKTIKSWDKGENCDALKTIRF